MRKGQAAPLDDQSTSWQPDGAVLHHLILDAILRNNPIPAAYRINYVANFYVGPLVAMMEKSFQLTRSEWIVLYLDRSHPAHPRTFEAFVPGAGLQRQ